MFFFEQRLHSFHSRTVSATLFHSGSRDGSEQWKGERRNEKVLQLLWASASPFLRG
jgi:hypothetical protein